MKVFVILLLLCICRAGFAEEAAELLYFRPGNYSEKHFSLIEMPNGFEELKVMNSQFRGTVFDFWDEYLEIDWKSCDLTDALFLSGAMNMPQDQLVKTRNFRLKSFPLGLGQTSLKGLDLTDFEFSNGDFRSLDLSESRMKNAFFLNCQPPKMTMAQWRETRNFTSGNFDQLEFFGSERWSQIDLSRTVWHGTRFRNGQKLISRLNFAADAVLEDAAFLQCDLTPSKELTLEQVKSTWNYKTGRLHLCRWPKHIAEALETEYFGDPVTSGLLLKDPQGVTGGKEHPETVCLTGKIALHFSVPQPFFWFENADCPTSFFTLGSSMNQRMGLFIDCRFVPTQQKNWETQWDLSRTAFLGCRLADLPEKSLEDTIFVNCDLSKARNLTLEQVKSTWNYKAGRMSLCKWPKHIENVLEEEEKAKAQEEKK